MNDDNPASKWRTAGQQHLAAPDQPRSDNHLGTEARPRRPCLSPLAIRLDIGDTEAVKRRAEAIPVQAEFAVRERLPGLGLPLRPELPVRRDPGGRQAGD